MLKRVPVAADRRPRLRRRPSPRAEPAGQRPGRAPSHARAAAATPVRRLGPVTAHIAGAAGPKATRRPSASPACSVSGRVAGAVSGYVRVTVQRKRGKRWSTVRRVKPAVSKRGTFAGGDRPPAARHLPRRRELRGNRHRRSPRAAIATYRVPRRLSLRVASYTRADGADRPRLRAARRRRRRARRAARGGAARRTATSRSSSRLRRSRPARRVRRCRSGATTRTRTATRGARRAGAGAARASTWSTRTPPRPACVGRLAAAPARPAGGLHAALLPVRRRDLARRGGRFGLSIERALAPPTAALICVCDDEREVARAARHQARARCAVVHNGCPSVRRAARRAALVVGAVTVLRAPEAPRRPARRRPADPRRGARRAVVIAGDGPEGPALRAHPADPRVVFEPFRGHRPSDHLRELRRLRARRRAGRRSRSASLEALACGVPQVAPTSAARARRSTPESGAPDPAARRGGAGRRRDRAAARSRPPRANGGRLTRAARAALHRRADGRRDRGRLRRACRRCGCDARTSTRRGRR